MSQHSTRVTLCGGCFHSRNVGHWRGKSSADAIRNVIASLLARLILCDRLPLHISLRVLRCKHALSWLPLFLSQIPEVAARIRRDRLRMEQCKGIGAIRTRKSFAIASVHLKLCR